MKKTKEIKMIGRTTYKILFDNAVRCGEFSKEGCSAYSWDVKSKDGNKFKIVCTKCKRETEIEILQHNKYIRDAAEEKKNF